jgi:flagellar hook-associated protein 3 FlgL
MTRVSSYGTSQLLLSYTLRTQDRVVVSQEQIASGYKTQSYKGVSRDAVALEGAKSLKERLDTYLKTNRLVENRVQAYDGALQQLGSIAEELRQSVLSAVGNNSGTALAGKVRDLFDRAVDALNRQVDGRYIFSGTRTDTPPVAVTTSSGLLTTTPIANMFANDANKLSAKLDDNLSVTYGVLASDAATSLFSEMQRILQFDAGTLPSGAGAFAPAGAYTNPLTANQRDFLSGELPTLATMTQGIQDIVAQNGIIARTLADAQTRQEQSLISAKTFIGDIQDADAAEAISNLNRDQTALEASYQVLSQLTRLNLLDFLR